MKIYMASSWKNASWVREIAEYLRKQNFEVDDFTDDSKRFVFSYIGAFDQEEQENMDARKFLKDPRAIRAFVEDKKWIDWADAVVLVLPAGRSAHLEGGYAKGQGKLLIIISPGKFPKGEFDVMYGLADLLTTQPPEIKKFLKARESCLSSLANFALGLTGKVGEIVNIKQGEGK
jgi:hypothetical protein